MEGHLKFCVFQSHKTIFRFLQNAFWQSFFPVIIEDKFYFNVRISSSFSKSLLLMQGYPQRMKF